MANPVWVLSVDLQTKTATFQSGMADAAKSARSAFRDIGDASAEGAAAIGKHSMDIRHTLGLVDNVMRGDHMRAFVDMIRIYQNSAIVMGLLPFAAVAGGFALIAGLAVGAAVKMHEWRLEQEALGRAMTDMGTAGQEAFNKVRDQLLEAEKHAAELHHNYLEALTLELQLIDHQSLEELIKQFDALGNEADKVFKRLEGHWYTLGIGSDGAQHALAEFKSQYDALNSQGKGGEAGDLLKGTLKSAQDVLTAMQHISAQEKQTGGWSVSNKQDSDALRKAGITNVTQKEVEAQKALVDTLQQQLDIADELAKVKAQDSANARTQTDQQASALRSAAAKEAVDSQLRVAQSVLAGEKATADAQLAVHRAGLEARLQSDLDFAARDFAARQAANAGELAALDKGGKDYQNQVKALNDKALEEQAQYDAQVAELKSRAAQEMAARDLANLEEAIRSQIAATQEGSAARVAAIDAGIREEQAQQLQDTQFYRDLLTQRVEVARQMADAERKQREEAGSEGAGHTGRMSELQLAAEKQAAALSNSGHHVSASQRIAQAQHFADEEYQIKKAALDKQIQALDTSDKDYINKVKDLQDKEAELTREHENELTQIKEQAEIQRNNTIMSAEQHYLDQIAQGLTNVIMRHQTFAQMMTSLSNEVVSGMLHNAIMSMMTLDMDKEKQAAAAARQMFVTGTKLPFPANIVAAPVLAAGAFAAVMAYQEGTDSVPGVMPGDRVPAMLEKGEGVVPGGVMDGLRDVARNGGFNQKPSMVLHVRPTYNVQAIDGDGMQAALEKHSDQLEQHMQRAVRRLNK